MRHHSILIAGALLAAASLTPGMPSAQQAAAQPEQRSEITIKNYDFVLSQPVPIRLHTPTVIILRNQDIIRHGFTSPMLASLMVRGEGEGISAYGKGIEGFYIDAGKTLVLRFTPERSGKYSFRCDLHPDQVLLPNRSCHLKSCRRFHVRLWQNHLEGLRQVAKPQSDRQLQNSEHRRSRIWSGSHRNPVLRI